MGLPVPPGGGSAPGVRRRLVDRWTVDADSGMLWPSSSCWNPALGHTGMSCVWFVLVALESEDESQRLHVAEAHFWIIQIYLNAEFAELHTC